MAGPSSRKLSADAELCKIPGDRPQHANDLKHGYSLGAAAVLGKPIRRDELFTALAKVNVLPRGGTRPRPRRGRRPEGGGTRLRIISPRSAISPQGIRRRARHPIAGDEHPDLVILDLMMPEVNGFMVVDKLRENPRTSDIPIIILTAKIVSADERRRLNGHIVAIAEKSGIDRAAFLSEVNRAVRLPAA